MAERTWRDLSYMESTDLVREMFNETHSRSVSATRAHATVAAFTQGRRYFEAAAAADILVKPPLLLYGVIALARGLMLFVDPSRGEEALSPSHEIRRDAWTETLGPSAGTSSGLKQIPDLRATFSKGTFTDLATVTKNVERAPITVQPPERVEYSATGTQDLSTVSITLQEALSRLPDLATTYERTFTERSRCYPARFIYQRPHLRTRVEIGRTVFFGLPPPHHVRQRFALPSSVEVTQETKSSVITPPEPVIVFTVSHPDENSSDGLPPLVADARGVTYAIATNEPQLSLLLTTYLLTFFTGTIARYYPSLWLSLHTPTVGDRLAPIIREAVEATQNRYPELIMREIRYALPAGALGGPYD